MNVLSPKDMQLNGGVWISSHYTSCSTIISYSSTQTTLDSTIRAKPHVPQFTTAGLLDYIKGIQSCTYFLLIGLLIVLLIYHLFDKENFKESNKDENDQN